MIDNAIKRFIAKRQEMGLYRRRSIRSADKGVDFNCNDYLSLRKNQLIKKAYEEGYRRYPVGSGGSMLISGYHDAHHALEQSFADALGVDQCLIFSSGYAANLSIANLLGALKVKAVIDKGIHASIYDGLNLSQVPFVRYHHQDIHHLSKILLDVVSDKVILTESIFSMSGQRALLADIAALAKSSASKLIVDEAHAFGITGREGLGAVIEDGLTQEVVPLRVIPLGKAFASSGAIVAGKALWVEALLQCARSFTYSTAISPAAAYGMEYTLQVIREADKRRAKLNELVQHMRLAISKSRYTWRDSQTPIQQLQLGCPKKALHISNALLEKGIFCLPIRQPTVSKRETGLRVILNYDHEPETINYLFKCLEEI